MSQSVRFTPLALAAAALVLASCGGGGTSSAVQSIEKRAKEPPLDKVISATDCNSEVLGTTIAPDAIGEPVSGVTLNDWSWIAATASVPAYCRVGGQMHPIDPAAPPINFRVALPSTWAHRYVQVGGGGMNGSIPGLTGGPGAGTPTYLARGWAVAGSDSGHTTGSAWALNDEAMNNLGYMQMKKTRDAARVLMNRMYEANPQYAYWVGNSQGGREGLTVAKRYPSDFNGIVATVPIVNFSTLMLGPVLLRIQEKPLANWVTPAKRTAIATHVMRKCDNMDGLADGIVNNYQACRAFFDINQGTPGRQPWAEKRCEDNVDPNPADTTANACLTDGQIATLQFTHTRYIFATPLAFNNRSFGMWLPGTDPGGSGLIQATRFRSQEGAAPTAPIYTHLGILGVTGFLFKDLTINPLEYVEGGTWNARRIEISEHLDATHPDLTGFYKSGGKLISIIGTNDTLASPGSQLDYFQSLNDRMGAATLDQFARLYVMPQGGHGLTGSNYNIDGDGNAIPSTALPSTIDRVGMMVDWVEKGIAPPTHATLSGASRSLPLCSYPAYPRYKGGGLATNVASSYDCAQE
jgi:pimeloyl-ACP methyl ester carboxylesterase